MQQSRATVVHGASPADRAVTLQLPAGDVGTDATCLAMRAVAEDAAANSQGVARLASTLRAGFVPRTLYDWLSAHVRFRRDEKGIEHIRHPDVLLAQIARDGVAQVDCDCLATLACAVLLKADMLRPCLVVVTRQSFPAEFAHVFYGTWMRNSALPWKLPDNVQPPAFVPYDPQERTPAGQMPGGVRRFRVYPF